MRTAAKLGTAGLAGAGLLLALTAAQRPSVLSQTRAGLWELSGLPGDVRRKRLCIRNPDLLMQVEHRRSNCTRTIVRDQPTSAEVHYTCTGSSGFGRSTIDMLTPRSLRVETQGISGNAPFHYVLQARRIGNCPGH